MLIKEITNIVNFPTKDRDRSVRMDRLRKRSSYYDEITGKPTDKHPDMQPDEFYVVDPDGKAHAVFYTTKEAEAAIPELSMKSGRRDLVVVPSIMNTP